MPPRHVALALLVVLLWGSNFVVIDIGLEELPPFLLLALRFTVVLVPAIFLVPKPDLPWSTILAVGATMSLGQFALLYLGLSLGMPPGLASLVLQVQVIVTIAASALVLGERPGRVQLLGIGIAVVGVAIVALGRSGDVPLIALALVIVSAATWAVGNVITRKAGAASGLGLTVWSAIVVPVPMAALSFAVDGPERIVDALANVSPLGIGSIVYTAVVASLVGYGIWNSLLARHPASSVVPFAMLVPVIGIATSVLVRGERPAPAELVGGAVLLVGIAIANGVAARIADVARGRRRAPDPVTAPITIASVVEDPPAERDVDPAARPGTA
ncbi:O-acetylserine/cysteine exporter [Agrococcus versicolor]|uniref:O-acetylserine/cysteine exporter n=1 Tax=Agrococcus versicolor TaxID=501482 RepID=A0ABP5ML59_9MICO